MQVLALAAPRRGIGRTVLIDRLARLVERAGTGPVVLLDADPNQQLTQHWATALPKRPRAKRPPGLTNVALGDGQGGRK